jgi:hypothetical protein
MRGIRSIVFLYALVLATAAGAQSSVRVRGAITQFDGHVLTVKAAAGKAVAIQLAEKTAIVFTQPIAIEDIKPGDFLGVTSMKREDGTLAAFEVRRFPKPLNPGHRPFDGRDDQTMTNATVDVIVEATKGRELTLSYAGGSQRIVVQENASISMLVPGSPSQLVPGAAVNLTAAPNGDGVLTAQRIQVSPVKPPR